ncbi:MAG: hypothetical protein OEV42_06445 [Deltaproteobacteria bacterium]|nr:hypothetical protein [Deltaproteobacteria bacterium]
MSEENKKEEKTQWTAPNENRGYLSGKKRLGEMLIEKGLINESQLEAAIKKQKQWGGRLGANLVKLNYITEVTLLKFLGRQLELPCTDLTKIKFDKNVYSIITLEIAKQYHVIPIEKRTNDKANILFLAMSDPTNTIVIDEISFLTGYRVNPVIGTDSQIAAAIDRYYFERNWVEIKPLSSRVKTLKQEEMVIVNESAPKETMEAEETSKELGKSKDLLALIRVLVKKGHISVDEFKRELKAVKNG